MFALSAAAPTLALLLPPTGDISSIFGTLTQMFVALAEVYGLLLVVEGGRRFQFVISKRVFYRACSIIISRQMSSVEEN